MQSKKREFTANGGRALNGLGVIALAVALALPVSAPRYFITDGGDASDGGNFH